MSSAIHICLVLICLSSKIMSKIRGVEISQVGFAVTKSTSFVTGLEETTFQQLAAFQAAIEAMIEGFENNLVQLSIKNIHS